MLVKILVFYKLVISKLLVISGDLVVTEHALGELWLIDALIFYTYSLPAILIATALVVIVNKRISAKKFQVYLFY